MLVIAAATAADRIGRIPLEFWVRLGIAILVVAGAVIVVLLPVLGVILWYFLGPKTGRS